MLLTTLQLLLQLFGQLILLLQVVDVFDFALLLALNVPDDALVQFGSGWNQKSCLNFARRYYGRSSGLPVRCLTVVDVTNGTERYDTGSQEHHLRGCGHSLLFPLRDGLFLCECFDFLRRLLNLSKIQKKTAKHGIGF